MQLLRKYKDIMGRIISVYKDHTTKKYETRISTFDRTTNTVSLVAYSYPNREACLAELTRFPKDKKATKELNK